MLRILIAKINELESISPNTFSLVQLPSLSQHFTGTRSTSTLLNHCNPARHDIAITYAYDASNQQFKVDLL